MKKSLLVLFLLAGWALTLKAQRNCGSVEYMQMQMERDPSVSTRMQQIEAFTQKYIAENPQAGTRAVYTIPVVVHVVYNTSTQNISESQIKSQITILNQDFRRTNADKVNTPSTFSSVVADAEIEFCLATKDPWGNATSGITRTSTSVTSFDHSDKMKYNSTGGKDAWNTSQYLNIWVCNLGGGLLGYAQFPGGAAATDGVVIGHKYFGNTGTATAPFNKGRTATHEVGHWLNLRHIWGDASCGNDYVSDTPVQQTSNTGCPSHPKYTCSNTTGDMFMNYMDYVDDGCMNSFTLGQKSRMRALFASGGARYSLLSSPGCSGTTTTTCATPGALGASSITSSGATLSWGAVSGATSYNVRYKPTSSTTWTTTTSSTTSKGISGLSASTQYEFQVQAVCSTTGSYSGSATFTTASSTTSTTTTLTVGSGTATTGIAPYGTYYMDEKVQFIITKDELVAAGYTSSNNVIKALGFNVYSASSQTMNGFSIKMRHTTASSIGTSFYSQTNMVTVYSANIAAKAGWNTHTFGTAFTYNGVDNLLIEICWNNSSYTSDSKVYCTSTSAYRTLVYRADASSSGVCGNTSGTQSYNRPNMRFTMGSSSTTSKVADITLPEETISDIEAAAPAALNVFPNPATSYVHFAYELENDSKVQLSVYNMMGAEVMNIDNGIRTAGAQEIKVDLSGNNLPAGIYLVTLKAGERVETTRFIISR